MKFRALSEFIHFLGSVGDLHRIKKEVDPYLEVTEISTRALREGKPAILFENVKGSRFPLAMNVYSTEKRIKYALGKHPGEIGRELIDFFERILPPSLESLWSERRTLRKIASSYAARRSSGLSQEICSTISLNDLPIQTCWPKDGGRFITLGQVITYDPITKKRNIGIYRIQAYDRFTAGMHWQIQKGGGFHYHQAEKRGNSLPVAVTLGTEPALLLASVAALPEGIDEALFAGFLRGSATHFVRGKKIPIDVPANAEFVIEGLVPPKERRVEGPFGDHFGHYSNAAPYPVLHIKQITHRRNPIFPGTVVGIPPMEDKYLGDATQLILGPLAKLIHKEVKDIWAYYEAGFHNLLVVSVEERYQKEAMKTALGLLGAGQLSLTKCLILVSEKVNVRDWNDVLQAIKRNFDPVYDFTMIPHVAIDSLDFTSMTTEIGSRMILDATPKRRPQKSRSEHKVDSKRMKGWDSRIIEANLIMDSLLVVKVKKDGHAVLEKILKKKTLEGIPLVAVVSDDIDIHNQENTIWGIFTRFDCAKDVTFNKKELHGITPCFKGTLGIDATWKKGYPEPLKMDPKVIRKVDSEWNEYWK